MEARAPQAFLLKTLAIGFRDPVLVSSIFGLSLLGRVWTPQEVPAFHALGYFFLQTSFSCTVYLCFPLLSFLLPFLLV